MAIEINGKTVTRFAAQSGDEILPRSYDAETITRILSEAWTLPTGEVVYAYQPILQPKEWATERGIVGHEITEGRMFVSVTREGRENGRIIAASSLVAKDSGHIEIGRIAADPQYPGGGWLAVADSLRIVQEQKYPGAIVDIASNRTAMTAALSRAAEQTNCKRLAIYVSHAAYGKRDIASWGCFGEYVVNPDFLEKKGGRLTLPIPDDAPQQVQLLLQGMGLINHEFLKTEQVSSHNKDFIPSRLIVEGEIVAVDVFNKEELLGMQEAGYLPSGILPVAIEGDIRWMVQFCREEIPPVVAGRARELRRDRSCMYTEDKKQTQVANLVRSLYPTTRVALNPIRGFQIAT